MAVATAMEILREKGYEPRRLVADEYIDCFCFQRDCNVVRGVFVLVIELSDGRYAVFVWRSHTQSDCDAAGIPLDECDVSRMDEESLKFIGIFSDWEELYSSVCPRYGNDDS